MSEETAPERGRVAQVLKRGVSVATLERTTTSTRFSYLDGYTGEPVGHALPLGEVVELPGAAVPPWFANLLPEGRRLGRLRRAVKTSADDDFSLLVAAGADPVGDVSVVADSEHAPVQLEVSPDVDQVSFRELILEGGIDPSSIPGVQDKLSSGMITVPVSTPHGAFIFKLNPPDYPFAVENEAFFLTMAKGLGIAVSAHRIVHDRDGESALVVERFDRLVRSGQPLALAVEDGCQLLNIYPADKYNVSAEEVVDALSSVCSSRAVAVRNAYVQLLFAWLTGDGDVHAKNLSVVHTLQSEWRVSPMYDVPSTLPYGDNTMAITMGGRSEGLVRKDLLDFGQNVGLSLPAATSALERVLKTTAPLVALLESGAMPFNQHLTRQWIRQVTRRRRDAIRL